MKTINRLATLRIPFWNTIDGFLYNRKGIGDRSLQGQMPGLRAFSINDDHRVVYVEKDEHFLLMDVGTHEQVYIR